MQIVYDQQVFLLQEYGGISRYFCSLAGTLNQIENVSARIIAPLHFNGHLQQIKKPGIVWGLRAPVIPKTARFFFSASELAAKVAIAYLKPDIVHETYFSTIKKDNSNAARVLTVYDMTHELFASSWPGSEVTSEAKRKAALRADHITCISHSTRNDLLNLFELPEEKVSVVHIGYDGFSISVDDKDRLVPVIDGDYLLFVGKRDGYKNFEGMLRAIAASSVLKDAFKIVCFGGGVLTQDEIKLLDELKIQQNDVIQLGGDDDLLANLYLYANAFVYPSRYEGFGIPPLEAMSLDCPVICSNTSSIPEVVGDAGEYFEPGDIESIQDSIERVVQSDERKQELISKGQKRCLEFTWERCANETMKQYQDLL